ncbi:MAG: methyltransferase domain-containing protein [Chitinivibrionales bacterium]|nr:methyltransferase domain-containing protein [Chitinivibrionales bacterium]
MTHAHLVPFNHRCSPDDKYRYNRRLFEIVAPRYDRVTRLLSFCRDQAWKKRLVQLIPDMESPCIGDIACGTGDIARLCRARFPSATITGIDLTLDMLRLALRSACGPGTGYTAHNMDSLGIRAATFDVVTGGYALRNAPSLPDTLHEISRVLKPGGSALFLDFAKPDNPAHAYINLFFLELWGTIFGIFFHRNRNVYAYIARSLKKYPSRKRLADMAKRNGLRLRAAHGFFLGYIDILHFQKSARKSND